jgi:hypothetical protein
MSRSSKWSLSHRFPHKNSAFTYPVSHTCHMPRPSHSSWDDYSNKIWQAVQIIRSSLCSLLHSPVTLDVWGLNIFLGTLFSNTRSLCSSLTSTLLQNRQNLCEQVEQISVSRCNKERVPVWLLYMMFIKPVLPVLLSIWCMTHWTL